MYIAKQRFMFLNIKVKKMYAVIKTGGKQYRVTSGDVIKIEKIAGEEGKEVVSMKPEKEEPKPTEKPSEKPSEIPSEAPSETPSDEPSNECTHEALTNEEIQEVFDNDVEK